jgi:hypothetical protein
MDNADLGRRAALTRVVQVTLVVAAILFVYEQAIIARSVIPPLVVFLVVDLVVAALIARACAGRRWLGPSGWRW